VKNDEKTRKNDQKYAFFRRFLPLFARFFRDFELF